jgi:hypothetical protein
MTICNSKQEMTSEYRQLQYELQCQEALLVLMQKLKANQRISTQTNNVKEQTTASTPVNTTKLNSITPIKQPLVYIIYSIYLKTKETMNWYLFFRIQQIDRHQLNHLIQINIQLIDQIIIILSNNHQNCLYHYLKLLARQIIVHYQQQLLVYHRQFQLQQQKLLPYHRRQIVLQKVYIY